MAKIEGGCLCGNIRYEIDDPQGVCRDVSEIGHWANGDIEFRLEDSSQIDYAMGLIRQSFAIHGEETGA